MKNIRKTWISYSSSRKGEYWFFRLFPSVALAIFRKVGNGSDGVYTKIGIQQQQIDVFGIAPRLRLQKERVALAEDALDLSVIELEREVSRAWAQVYTTKSQYRVYEQLDSLFIDIIC